MASITLRPACALNVAVAKEIPAFGSIISYELSSRRAASDTFPAYVSTGLTKSRVGAMGAGFLPTQFSGLDLDPQTVFDTFGGNREGMLQLLERRWKLLAAMSEASVAQKASMGSKATDYRAFYEEAYDLLNDQRWASAFAAAPEEREKYGNDEYGLGLILAKNLIAKNAWTAVRLCLRRRPLGSSQLYFRPQQAVQSLPHVHAAR